MSTKSSLSFAENVEFIREVERDLGKLDGSVIKQIARAINKVAKNPYSNTEGGYGVPLRGKLSGYNKIKVKNTGLRVVYKTKREYDRMIIIVIAARADNYVYKEAERRIQNLDI